MHFQLTEGRLQPSEADLLAVKTRVVQRARSMGAAAVRVASAESSPATRSAMEAAFGRGDYETWGFDEAYAHAASDPGSILPDARSVVCVAVPYATQRRHAPPLYGTVSVYAWSHDYHQRLRPLLTAIAEELDAAAGRASTVVALDTRTLAERAFAARAGLGWVGKHTGLIAPGAGPFVFLGEVVTSLALPPDAPLKKTCGSCSRCVQACPTGALRGDYTLDARRCIADLTQRTDWIPREMRPLIGTWVWGCDICQDVCPPAQRATAPVSAENEPLDEATAAPSLVALLGLRSGEYRRRYRRTAMGWRGAAVLRRNAAVALGNALDRSAVPALARAVANDPHPMVRGHAAWALGRISGPYARRALEDARATEADERVRKEIADALEPFSSSDALNRL